MVVARIISVDGATGKIFASTRQRRDDPAPAPAGAFESVEVGNVVSGEVAAVHESNIVLTLKPSRAKALISLAMLARHKGTDVETIRSSTVKGTTLEDLVVVSKNPSKSLVIVGLIPSKAVHSQPLEAHLSNLTFDSLVVGQKLQGRVSNKVPAGLIVQLSRTIRGRVPRTEIADDYDQSAEPTIGSFVQCLVLSIDSSNHRAELSLRPSRLGAAGKVRDLAVTSLDNLTAGQRIRGFVKNVANHGVFVELGSGVTARVQIKASASSVQTAGSSLTNYQRIHRNFSTSSLKIGSRASALVSSSKAKLQRGWRVCCRAWHVLRLTLVIHKC